MLKWVWDRVRVRESEQPCWFSWAILATWPLTLLLGMSKTFLYNKGCIIRVFNKTRSISIHILNLSLIYSRTPTFRAWNFESS
jgi:hypothetical protein